MARRGKPAAFLAAALLASCGLAAAANVTVFAAASLGGAIDEVARDFQAASGHRVRVSLAASSALARQIEAGAPAQVFISADTNWMAYLAGRGLIDGEVVPLLTNALVFVAPVDRAPALVTGMPLDKLLGAGRLAIADPVAVPAGRYARAALESVGQWKAVESRLAPAADVRAALALVARGEAPLGIVYATDARAEPRVVAVGGFPPTAHPPIAYPLGIVKGASAAARDFARFAASPGARATWNRHGFGSPP